MQHEQEHEREDDRGERPGPVPATVIRTKIHDLDGPVTTQQIIDHLAAHSASPAEIATIAALPDRNWDDYNDALAFVGSGFDPEPR
ncbi:MAG: hypothetical protein WA964_16655 [Ilumatobacter sp.]|uniref:hypothetical protein n=1 Tax=Ilumatobacter sp. TaxID=1967498 RepID=UPI003C75FF0F